MVARLSKFDITGAVSYIGSIDSSRAENYVKIITETASPKVFWKLYPIDIIVQLPGNDIKKLLKGCRNVVLFGATLGMQVEALIRKAQLRSMEEALLLDACADSAIENVCDNFCEDLQNKLAPCYLTDRFSPGYGDLPLEFQKELFRMLDLSKHCGIQLSDSCLMLPQKSVTAIIGISDTPKPQPIRGCDHCKLRQTCNRREEKSCGRE